MAINFPSAPTEGQTYSYGGRIWVADADGKWLVQTQVTPAFYASATAPSNYKVGDEWYDTSTGIFYRRIDDGDTEQWVEIGPSNVGVGEDAYGLAASVAANALTISVKDKDGNDPSTSSLIRFLFRSATATTGTPVARILNAALSLTINSTATMGATSGASLRIWIVLFDDGGTLRLGAINCRSGVNIYPLRDDRVVSSTTVGTGADSAYVFYSDTGVTSKAYRILGYFEWTTLTTAGTWTAPDKLQLLDSGVALPGQAVQSVFSSTGATSTGSTAIPTDNTIPQNTEGTEFLTQAITPTSAANVLALRASLFLSTSAVNTLVTALFQDSTANALAAGNLYQGINTGISNPIATHRMVSGTASSTTFKARGGSAGGTYTINGGYAIGQVFGGALLSTLEIEEIMA
jgi:hypothetical protein